MRTSKLLILFILAITFNYSFGQEIKNTSRETTHFNTSWSGNPFSPMTFLVSEAAMDGQNLTAGDEVGIFDGDECVGAGALESSLDPTDPDDYLSIAASKDDGSGNGFTEGDTITYKLWRASDDTEVVVENPEYPYDENNSEVFIGLGTNFVLLSQGQDEPPLEITSVSVEDIMCNGESNGSISVTATGGTPPYKYSITGGDFWQDSSEFTGLDAGNYYVMVKDDTGEMVSYSENPVMLNEPEPIQIFSVYSEDVSEPGAEDGSIGIEAGGGTGTLSYTINGGDTWQTGESFFSGLAVGSYTVGVKDENGCEKFYSDNPVLIEEPSPGLEIIEVSTLNPLCNGESNGFIGIDASGGTPPYQYSISGGDFWQDGSEFNDLAAGSYYVMVKDDTGQTVSYSGNPVMLTDPEPVQIFGVSSEDVSEPGANDGSITIEAGGGTGTLSYTINGGDTWQMSEPIFNGLAPGSYTVGVKDENGCEKFYSDNPVIIDEPEGGNHFEPVWSGNPFEPMNFLITGASINGTPLEAGDEIGIFDGNLCVGAIVLEDSINSGDSTDFVSVIASKDDGTNNGYTEGDSITYKLWDEEQSQEEVINNPIFPDPEFAYQTFVALETNLVLLQVGDGMPIEIENVESFNPTCYGDENGSITITASGGTEPLMYSIDGGDTYQADSNFYNLPAGDYNVMVKDDAGQEAAYEENPVTLTQPDELIINSVTPTDVQGCYGNENGEIMIEASGGTGALMYSINNGETWQDSGQFTGLTAGEYNVMVMDNNECVTEYSDNPVIIDQPDELVINSVTPTDVQGCFGNENGEIMIEASGGTGALMYSINNGETWQDSGQFTGLTAGEYNVMVMDNNECVTEYSDNPVIIDQPPQLVINSVEIVDVNCVGAENGAIYVQAEGGSGELMYSINGGDTWEMNGGEFENLAAGTYNVMVKDTNDCMVEYAENPVEITAPEEELVINSVESDNPNCYGCSNGAIYITASGGTGDLMYSINDGESWQNNGTFEQLGAGDYEIVVKDANNCMVYYDGNPFTLQQPGEDTHFDPVWSGNPYNAMNVFVTQALIDGESASDTLEIGLFDYNSQGEMICVGVGKAANITEENFLTILASQNDAVGSDPQNGFIEGHEIMYKIWDGDQEYTNIDTTYPGDFPTTFQPLATTNVQLDAITTQTQEIPLLSGWNILSMNVKPDTMNMLNIVQPLIDDGTLVKVQDESGNSIQYLPWLGTWNNSIGDMAVTEGYQIKVNTQDTLEVTGSPAEVPHDIPLIQGWNIMGYPPEYPQNGLDAVQPLIDNGTLVKVQDEGGNSIQYLPWLGTWNNSIGDFMAGEGYQIKVNSATTLTINQGTAPSQKQRMTSESSTDYFNTVYEGNPYQAMNIIVKSVDIEGITLESGDEIAAFDTDSSGNALCVGAGVIDPPINEENPYMLITSMDDPTTDEQDGFLSGNEISIRIYDESTGEVIYPSDISYHPDYDDTYTEMGTAVADVSGLITGVDRHGNSGTIQLHPNPAASTTQLVIGVNAKADVKATLYDGYGRKVEDIYRGAISSTFNTTINTADLPAGVYFVKVLKNNNISTRKLIVK